MTNFRSDNPPDPRPRFFWFALWAGAITLCLFIVNGVAAYRYGLLDKFGYELMTRGDAVLVTAVHPGGPAEGKLQVGDRVLGVNELDVTQMPWRDLVQVKFFHAPLGTVYRLRVARGDVQLPVRLALALYRVPDAGAQLRRIIGSFILSLAFAVVALLAGALKPADPIARRACRAFLAFALNYLYTFVIGDMAQLLGQSSLWYWYFLHYCLSGATLYLALGYHLYYRFPANVPPGKFWTGLQWFLYGYGGLILLGGALKRLSYGAETTEGLLTFYRVAHFIKVTNEVYNLIGLVAICAVIVRNHRLVTEAAERNRIKLVIHGTVAGILPNVIYFLIAIPLSITEVSFSETFSPGGRLGTLLWLCNTTPILIAGAWAYAIFKYQVLDIRVVVRRGVRYLLARNVLRIILALPLFGLVAGVIADPNRTVREIIVAQPVNAVLIVLAALSLRYRRQLRAWLDRRFFRGTLQQEHFLLRLIEKLKYLSAPGDMARLVGQQMETALYPTRVHVCYLEAGQAALTVGYTSESEGQEPRLAVDAQLLRLLEGRTKAVDFPSPPCADLPPAEQRLLEEAGVSLIVPMNGPNERLFGLLLLGEKRSEQPYTEDDRALLQAVARQMAMVGENVRLKEQVEKELKIKHEVLAHLDGQQINLVKECPVCGTCYDSEVNYCLEDGRELSLSLPVERTVDGKYRLEKLLGKGGMGAVYAATDLRLGRQVAVKILTGSLFGNRSALQRFEREARASARLNHPNIVAVHDYGRAGAEGAYLVMELVRGGSLRTELNRRGPLAPTVAADWFGQLLEGVKAAHAAGVIHRDLKPENILVSTSQRPGEQGRIVLKILDFGLAKLRRLPQSNSLSPFSLTMPGMVIGTPGYMSPEQFFGEEADERGDIFAVGVLVIEALTGRHPFVGESLDELRAAVLNEVYRLPDNRPGTDRLNAVLRKCLARERTRRYVSATALQDELIPALLIYPPAVVTQGLAEFAPTENLSEAASRKTLLQPEAITQRPDAVTKVD